MANAATVGARHLPAPAGVGLGTTCFYINRGKRRNGRDGYLIECVCYVNGVAPEQTTPDFTANSLPINANPIVDPATGQTRQVIHSYRALFFGQSAIIEVEKGGGGTATLALALTNLLRAHVDPTLPGIELMDVVGADLRRSIAAAGGVERISARLATSTTNRRRPLSFRLSRLKQWAGGRAVVHADIEFPDGENTNKGIAALDEYAADNGLDSVAVHLRDGQKITGLRKFVEKRRMDIQLNPSGAYNMADIEDTMWNYLDELRRPDNDGWRIIDSEGRPAGARLIDQDDD
ncbi:hypothetical protein [Lysobacter changpingensis]|uniref:hypothetical protein n=1 Tax=Lysobacter changpingensis TaxID=2792784 RepID=UPI001A8EFA11|nr:hypothetical protein [Lysobacter changpingensis]